MKPTEIAAIDIGSSKVRTLIGTNDGNSSFRMLGLGVAPDRPGISELAHRVTNLPARIGSPSPTGGLPDFRPRDPLYATRDGLLLWQIKNRRALKWLSSYCGIPAFTP